MNRRQLISACALTFAFAAAAAGVGANSWNRSETLEFGSPIALPGVALPPGAYSFELADPNNASLVLVREKATRNPKFIGFTLRVPSPAGAAAKGRVVLGEAKRGEAPRVKAWFPSDQVLGYQFIYGDAR